MRDIGLLFNNLARINRAGPLPRLEVWDNNANRWSPLAGGGSGGASALLLPADLPDFITMNGDTIAVEGR